MVKEDPLEANEMLIKSLNSEITDYDRYKSLFELSRLDPVRQQVLFDDVDSTPTSWDRISSYCLHSIDDLTLSLNSTTVQDQKETFPQKETKFAPGRPLEGSGMRKRTTSPWIKLWNKISGQNTEPIAQTHHHKEMEQICTLPVLLQSSRPNLKLLPKEKAKKDAPEPDFHFIKFLAPFLADREPAITDLMVSDFQAHVWIIRCNSFW